MLEDDKTRADQGKQRFLILLTVSSLEFNILLSNVAYDGHLTFLNEKHNKL